MDKKNLLKTFLAAAVAGGIALSANAQLVFSDDFSSYADTAAMTAVWGYTAGTTGALLATDPQDGSNNVASLPNTVTRISRSFATLTPTNDNPVVFEFSFYNGTIGADRQYAMISSGMFANIIAIGAQNHVTAGNQVGEAFDVTKYQIRLQHDGGWTQMASERVENEWATIRLEVFATTLNVYVNGVLDAWAQGLTHNSYTFTHASLGSNETGTMTGLYDNVSVSVIPEPSTYAAIFGGLALLGAFVYRRRLSVKK